MSALEVASRLVNCQHFSLFQTLLWFGEDQKSQTFKYLCQEFEFRLVDNIEDLILWFNLYYGSYSQCLRLFARLGSMEWVQFLVNQGISDLNGGIEFMGQNGHIPIKRLMLEHGDIYRNHATKIATKDELWVIIGSLLDLNHENVFLHPPMLAAVKRGHLEIVRLMAKLGVLECRDLNEALILATENGHMAIVQLMISLGATDQNKAMITAVNKGNIEMVQLLMDHGATNCDTALSLALGTNKSAIAELLKARGAISQHGPCFAVAYF